MGREMRNDETDNQRRESIRAAAVDPSVIAVRMDLARFSADTLKDIGTELYVFGHLLGPDRQSGASPFGHGDDAAVAVSLLLRIGSQLVSATADLIADGRHYAGCALLRQLVEVEYLAWAFETKDAESARWLRSSREERQSFFTPAKLRKAAEGHFRSVDYSYHCELGGHPTPGSWRLLQDDTAIAQLMLSDCLGHSGRVWDHIVGWSKGYTLGKIVQNKVTEMLDRYRNWKKLDLLTVLPPPPSEFID
jgi:hypothetical protein